MTSEDLLRLLEHHWTTVTTGLDADDHRELSDALRELREQTVTGNPAAAARTVRRIKRTLSALPPGHPVAEALGGHRYAAGPRELPRLATIDAVIGVLGTPPPDPAELLRAARRRLLAAPALTEAEHTALAGAEDGTPAGAEDGTPAGTEDATAGAGHHGPAVRDDAGSAPPPGGPDAPAAGLIRLRDPDDGFRYPRFQFKPGTAEPLPVVRRINVLLCADRDPWGAADWWLGGNRWLGGVPAELLGVVPDDALERAAAELVGAA
ncbi:hypothetical protein [Streptomyces rubradiris]|uniref:Uncharacterized protein n=1 Tax=Streptomyces rubradiris TaxID=285531 RepID=A0ABQ3REP2_STRRR|nr:hypothetical protein [Streptomyces rubradiris]GHG98076.1 hypothetical protein GCM10018792_10530 [Streptomyces rubradiris]GHI54328.1 hypothetical protein Srubr_41740 [Streptomyces rubradiris]